MNFHSILFVPADSDKKLAKSLSCDAHALIFDLEDAVSPERKPLARTMLSAFLRSPEVSAGTDKPLYIRVNDLSTGLLLDDLVATMALAPAGYVLPKCTGPRDLEKFGLYLDALEAAHGLPIGQTGIIPIATETAGSVLGLWAYAPMPRLHALMWGAEDLSADIGASSNREVPGDASSNWSSPFMLARSMCLLAAAQAGVPALDAISVETRDIDAVRHEAEIARRDGFAGKAAIHPAQATAINAVFKPRDEEVRWAERALAAVEAAGGGVAQLDGQMLDAPHLKRARKILALRQWAR